MGKPAGQDAEEEASQTCLTFFICFFTGSLASSSCFFRRRSISTLFLPLWARPLSLHSCFRQACADQHARSRGAPSRCGGAAAAEHTPLRRSSSSCVHALASDGHWRLDI